MIYGLILLILLPLFLVRWARWLAIVQQKEYRLDRFISFLQSEEGVRDVLRIFPSWRDFTRSGLKRPVRTMRMSVIAVVSVSLLLLFWLILWLLNLLNIQFFISSVVLFYLLMPLGLFISTSPTVLIVQLMTLQVLKSAQKKLTAANPKVIGVGGSYGKTSTKHILAQLLSQKYTVFVTPKSHNTKYSIAQSILQSYRNQEIAILEYAAYKLGEITYLTKWFPPDLAVETGFSLQHLALFGTAENSLQAESELVAALPLGQKVFCNASDEGAVKICEIGRTINKAEIVPYAGPNAVVSLENVQLDEKAQLSFGWRRRLVTTKIVGKHYVPNIQAAIAMALELGLSDEMIVAGLESLQPNESFISSSVLSSGAVWIDDGGTSNPTGFSAAIDLLKQLPQSQKILITAGIVDLGKESSAVHQRLASEAAAVFQTVAYVGIDGHSEFEAVFGDRLLTDKTQIEQLIQHAQVGTVILLEGRVPPWVIEALK